MTAPPRAPRRPGGSPWAAPRTRAPAARPALEAFILGAWSIPLLMYVPLYIPVLATLQVVGLVNNIVGHLGHAFMPPWFIRIPPFRFWDRLFGTEVPGYEQTFLARNEPAASPRPDAAR